MVRSIYRLLAKSINAATVLSIGIFALSCSGDGSGPITIDPPTSVSVVPVSPTTIRVTWTASAHADKVVSYNVFRNGTKLAQVTGTSFDDINLAELIAYTYAVSANGPSGTSSALSTSSAITLPDVTGPKILGITPGNGATGVPTSSVIDVTFNENVDQSTINAANFIVKTSGGTTIPGALTYTASSRIAEFRPSAGFPSGGTVSVSIQGVRDVAGNAMADAFASTFTTRDEIRPTVVASTPSSGATGVAITSPIVITFSEPINASTITATALTVTGQGIGAVSGAIAYDPANMRATFTPTGALQNSTTYTIAASSAITDVAGNALVAFSASFTTIAPPDVTPPAVIAVSPSNGATNVALSTAPRLTFNRPLKQASVSVLSVNLLDGAGSIVFAGLSYDAATNTVTITPVFALTPSTTYTIRATTDVLGSNDVPLAAQFTSTFTTAAPSGDNNAPTVLSSSPANGSTNVGVNVAPTLTFSRAMNAGTLNSSTIKLATSGGATVVANVSYDASNNVVTLTPAAPLTQATTYTITVTTGVQSSNNIPLGAQFTSAFTTIGSSDTTPPTIIGLLPGSGEMFVAVNTPFAVTFSEPMDPATLNTATITLSTTFNPTGVPGIVAYNAGTNTATFYPSAPLAFSTSYTLLISTGVKDVAGNSMASSANVVVTTASDPGLDPAVVTTASPPYAAQNVSVNTAVTLVFSKSMNGSTIVSPAFSLSLGDNIVPASVSYDDSTKTATLKPTSPLNYSSTYTIGFRARDVADKEVTYSSSFTTEKDPDLPKVIATSPPDGATNVAIDTPLTMTFDKDMNASTFMSKSMRLDEVDGAFVLPGNTTYNAQTRTSTFTPKNPLSYKTKYVLSVSGVSDVSGRGIETKAIAFTTMADPSPPQVLSVNPADGTTGVATNTTASVFFKGPMNASSINSSTIKLATNGGAGIPATVTFNQESNSATLTPLAALNNATTYRLTITTGVQSANGVPLSSSISTAFTTVALNPGNLTTIVLNNFCWPLTTPGFFAYKNDGGSWTRVFPDGSGAFTFSVTPRVVITFFRSVAAVETYYTTADELKQISGLGCKGTGSKTVNGSFSNLGASAPFGDLPYGHVAAGTAFASGTGSFTLSSVSDGPIDFVALDYAYNQDNFYGFAPTKAIIRRVQQPSSGSTVPVFDFNSIEGIAIESHQLTITGGLSTDWNLLLSSFSTANGTYLGWREAESTHAQTLKFNTLPFVLLNGGDLHQLTLWGQSSDYSSARSAVLYYKNGADKTIALGPNLNQPAFTVLATLPYQRIRATLTSQPEYGKAVRFEFEQSRATNGTNSWIVMGTAGYFGGTPATWDLDIPDLSAVPGFPGGFEPDRQIFTRTQAYSDIFAAIPYVNPPNPASLYIGRAPQDGDMMKFGALAGPLIPLP